MSSEENNIIKEYLKWVKENRLHLFIIKYIEVALSYLYSDHHEHYYDDNQYDHSGELRNTYSKNINKINTLSELLNCYVGYWVPTFISYYGKYYPQVSDEVHHALHELSSTVLYEYVKENRSTFSIDDNQELDDEIISDIIEENFDYMWLCEYDIIKMVNDFIGIDEMYI